MTSYPDLNGKLALITGASRRKGIGAATCRALAMQGANILFTTWTAYDRAQPHGLDENGPIVLQEELLALGVQARHLEIDLSYPASAAQTLTPSTRTTPSTCLLAVEFARRVQAAGRLSGRIINMSSCPVN